MKGGFERSKAPDLDDSTDEDEQSYRQEILALNIGVDFGTSFTKVCFRDVGREESGVVCFPSAKQPGLIPSLVGIGENGELSISFRAETRPEGAVTIDYLKMRLAGQPPTPLSRSIAGIELSSQASIRALSSWFLAKVLEKAKQQIRKDEVERVRRRTLQWSANVGVPVEHCDSPLIDDFNEVLGVAWRWCQNGSIPRTLGEALAEYKPAAPAEGVDFHAIPEIAAGVQSFVNSRSAAPGIYVYFDIGGGTVDGVSFKFFNDGGERRLNFYSGKVAPLGIAVAAASAYPKRRRGTEAELFEGRVSRELAAKLDEIKTQLQQLVATVILRGKQKDPAAWIGVPDQFAEYFRRVRGEAAAQDSRHLLIFTGGGGARSAWYRDAIVETYSNFRHDAIGLAPYRLVDAPVPRDLDLGDMPTRAFNRLAIAYGLSLPHGEGPDVNLPSSFEPMAPPPPPKPRPGLVDYADSKEAYQ